MSKKPVAITDWQKSICRPPLTRGPVSFSSYVSPGPTEDVSPIDNFLKNTESLLKRGNPLFFSTAPELSGLLLVATVSQTENYFREIFARLLVVCPVSQSKSAQRDMKLGSVIWFRTGRLERGAFEHFSLASSDNIIETLTKYFDIQIDQKSDPFALLQQFDLLCELRHAIVHSAGVISGKNSLKLKLGKNRATVNVDIDFQRFQDTVELCTALVCSMNIELFRKFGERWRDKWPSTGAAWNARVSRERFNELWRIFASTSDRTKGLPAKSLSPSQCRQEINTP